MACPEQRTWGRVLKRRFLWVLDHPQAGRALAPLVAAARSYRRLAQGVARDIAHYTNSGFDAVGVVGVAGSPSCGAGTTLDLATALQALGSGPSRRVTACRLNRDFIAAATCPGTGLFIHALTGALTRRGLTVPMSEVTITPAEAPPALSRLAEELPPVPSSPDIGGAAVARRGRFSSHTPIKGERAAGRLAAFESQNRRLSASDAPAGKDRRRAPRGRRPSSP